MRSPLLPHRLRIDVLRRSRSLRPRVAVAIGVLLTCTNASGCGSPNDPLPPASGLPVLALRGLVLRPGETTEVVLRNESELVVGSSLPSAADLGLAASDSRTVQIRDRRLIAVSEGRSELTVSLGGQSARDTILIKQHAATALMSISAGDSHTCGFDQLGQVWCWGENWFGQAEPAAPLTQGIGFAAARRIRTPEPAIALSAGATFTCMIGASGAAYCWGDSRDGQALAQASVEKGIRQYRHPSPFLAISAGVDHACALTSQGEAVCWGTNASGQLGTVPGPPRPPAIVGGIPALTTISAGGRFTCGTSSDNQLWCWGSNSYGNIDPASPRPSVAPQRIHGSHLFADVDAGQHHTCGLLTDRSLWCWGGNDAGQAGHSVPSAIAAFARVGDLRYLRVASGDRRTCAIDSTSRAYCWGSNEWGALGKGSTAQAPLHELIGQAPAPIESSHSTIDALAVGGTHHACALTTTRAPVCWGDNRMGQLGAGVTLRDSATTANLSTVPLPVRFR